MNSELQYVELLSSCQLYNMIPILAIQYQHVSQPQAQVLDSSQLALLLQILVLRVVVLFILVFMYVRVVNVYVL